MNTIDNFLMRLDGQQKIIVSFLHHHLSIHHDLLGKISYGIPFYYRKKSICYLNPIKNDGIELAFTKGYLLSNEQQLLNRKSRKHITGIDFFNIHDLSQKEVDEIIQEALILDGIEFSNSKK